MLVSCYCQLSPKSLPVLTYMYTLYYYVHVHVRVCQVKRMLPTTTASAVAQEAGLASEIEAQFERQIDDLKRAVREKQNVIDEKEEELYVLNEKHVSARPAVLWLLHSSRPQQPSVRIWTTAVQRCTSSQLCMQAPCACTAWSCDARM